MDMQVTERPDRICLIEVSGDLDAWNALPLGGKIHRLVKEQPRWIVLDMTAVNMLTSTGLSVLVQCNHQLIRQSFGLVLVGCSREIKSTLRNVRLDEALLMMPSFDEALLSLSGETIEMS